MFIGHYGIALGAKKIAPEVSLGTLFMASVFLDLLWPTFLLMGWEKVEIQPGITQMTPLNFTYYPFSHSLLMACVWALAFGGIYFLIKKNSKNALIVGLLVLSHWVLDFLVHRPDLPLLPNNSMLTGLGLWNYFAIETIIESAIFIIGIILYLNVSVSKKKAGNYIFWAMIVFIAIIQISNILGPPPPSTTMIAIAGQAQWLMVLWAYWADRNRTIRLPVTA